MRSPLTSMILARPCSVSVTMPACEPVNDTAGTPRSSTAMRHERHRDPLARGEQHVELAAVGVRRRRRARGGADRRSTCPSPTRRRRRRRRRGGCARRDRRRPGCDPGRPPRCRRTSGREARQSRLPASPVRRPKDSSPVHSAPMPSADKRARQKENARAAREQREAALKRKKRSRSTITVAIVVRHLRRRDRPAQRDRRQEQEEGRRHDHHARTTTVPAARPSTPDLEAAIDGARPTPPTIDDELRHRSGRRTLDAKNAPDRRPNTSSSSPTQGRLRRARAGTGSSRTSSIQGGAPGGRPRPGTTATRSSTELPEGQVQAGDVAAAKANDRPERHLRLAVLHRHRGAGRRHFRPISTPTSASVTQGMDVVEKIEALRDRRQTATRRRPATASTRSRSPSRDAIGDQQS